MDTIVDTPPSTPRRSRRPNFSVEFKRRVVEATLLPGASVALIAREHEVNAKLVFKWRRHYREGQLGPVAHQVTLLPVNLSKARRPQRKRQCHCRRVRADWLWSAVGSPCALRACPTRKPCNWSCSRCCDDCPAHRDSHLDRGWSHRHAAGVRWPGGPGANPT
ncbi:hypothetical protein DQ403_23090 [Stutzerimonas zhaodongensis]|uniref:Transposase n=1 Tax=Stutzerimonas zhaodongensis TaxID=1176257 RepID=A0A365PNF7_9GAMM|nr:hypothetical protein DQ403_23090 [Stutzerimonas zhaodongensis]